MNIEQHVVVLNTSIAAKMPKVSYIVDGTYWLAAAMQESSYCSHHNIDWKNNPSSSQK